MKFEKYLSVFLIIIIVLGVLFMFIRTGFTMSNKVPEGPILSFDVDSKGNIYIGTYELIRVYKDNSLIRIIESPDSRNYCFYIENDQLIIGCSGDKKGGTYDLEGNELSYGEFTFEEVEDASSTKELVANGHLYKLNEYFGFAPYTITCDGVEVYRMPTLDYVFNGIPFILIMGVMAFSGIFFILLKLSDREN